MRVWSILKTVGAFFCQRVINSLVVSESNCIFINWVCLQSYVEQVRYLFLVLHSCCMSKTRCFTPAFWHALVAQLPVEWRWWSALTSRWCFCCSPPGRRRYCFDRSDDEGEEEEKEEGAATRSSHYSQSKYARSMKDDDGENRSYETAS